MNQKQYYPTAANVAAMAKEESSSESEYESESEETQPKPIINKSGLTEIVKAWVLNDNQIRALNKKMRELRQEKKRHNESMINVMKQYDIDNFDVKDGQIHFRKANKREPLTQKKLLSILMSHPQLDAHQANHLNQFVYDSRQVTEEDVLSRKINKPKVDKQSKSKGEKKDDTSNSSTTSIMNMSSSL